MDLLDYLTLFSYLAINIDVLLQIRRIYHTKSSHDISLVGLSIRYVAILIIMIKFVTLDDFPLIIGQAFIVLTFAAYLALAIFYIHHRRPRGVHRK